MHMTEQRESPVLPVSYAKQGKQHEKQCVLDALLTFCPGVKRKNSPSKCPEASGFFLSAHRQTIDQVCPLD